MWKPLLESEIPEFFGKISPALTNDFMRKMAIFRVPDSALCRLGRLVMYGGAYHYIIEVENPVGISEKNREKIEAIPEVRFLGCFDVTEKPADDLPPQ